jgi:hypothetical protein
LAYGWSQSALFLPFRRGVLVVWGVFWFWFAKCNTFVPGFFLPIFFFFLIQKYAALLRIQEKKVGYEKKMLILGCFICTRGIVKRRILSLNWFFIPDMKKNKIDR